MRQQINWAKKPDRQLTCPACGTTGTKNFVLEAARGWSRTGVLDVFACPDCQSKFFPDLEVPDYESEGEVTSYLKYYLEVGAGVEQLVSHLFVAPLRAGARYLEVGCGFGFALDFARNMFGHDVVGIDPSPFAAAGKRVLGLPIISDYLKADTDLQGRRFNMAVASEVIEHIPDPLPFLKIIADRLTNDGVLVLTTPNARCIKPETGLGALLPALSTGWHVIIYSAQSLADVLRKAGFQRVEVVESDNSLYAAASNGDLPLTPRAQVNRAIFADYLERGRKLADQQTENVEDNRWLSDGLTYRLIREIVNSSRYGDALALFAELRQRFLTKYEFDFERPDTKWPGRTAGDSFAGFIMRAPACLCGLSYLRAIVALNHEQAFERAAHYFQQSVAHGEGLRAVMQEVGADDGEAEVLVRSARLLRLRALAHVQPAETAAELASLLDHPRESDAEYQSQLLDLFTHLANLGALDVLTDLTPQVERTLAAHRGAFSPRVQAGVLRALGLVELMQGRDRTQAALYLALSERAARRWAKSGADAQARTAVWRARNDRLLAYLADGAVARASLIARAFATPDSLSNLPDDLVLAIRARSSQTHYEVFRREGLKDINERKMPREAAIKFARAERAAKKWKGADTSQESTLAIWQSRHDRMTAWMLLDRPERAILIGRQFEQPTSKATVPAPLAKNAAKLIARAQGVMNLRRLEAAKARSRS